MGTSRFFRAVTRTSFVVLLTVLLTSAAASAESNVSSGSASSMSAGAYRVLAWNDLGMHCYNGSFADMMVLPPFNTLWAQVVRVGDPPSIVTAGVVVTYEFPNNTYSAGKTDFWDYATQVFGLDTTLTPNVGLKGKGLTGTLDATGDHFAAVGIPLTEYSDDDTSTRKPFQTAKITVRDSSSGAVLTSADVVTPVSSEMDCVMCHADDGDATTKYPITPTGDFQANILALHDYLSQAKYPVGHKGSLLSRRPVLCAECHADAALGAPGVAGISNLSNAMHRHHNPANAPDITADTDGCYHCHPGAETRCLRCVMSQRYSLGCVDCHGDITQVAKNPSPWLNEPKCSNAQCHGTAYATNDSLYRNSTGHGGIYCAGCHDSPHAIAPSREASDGIKFVELQGFEGTLRSCTVCHATAPSSAFSHVTPASLLPAYVTKPAAPTVVRSLRAFTVAGVLLPKHAVTARTVKIQVARRQAGKWAPVGTWWAANAPQTTYTRYQRAFRLTCGTYRFRAIAPADQDNSSSGWTEYTAVVVR